MPDVEIIVEASLGDSLAKLGLAREAVDELGNSSGSTGRKVSDFNRAMDDSTIASARAGESILKTDNLIRDAERTISDADAALGGGGSGGGLSGAFMALGDAGLSAQQGLTGVAALLPAIPLLIPAVIAAVIALASVFGTLVAIIADLVAPVTLVAGLLGGLAGGFFLAGTRALEGGPKFDRFKDSVSALGDQFKKTSTDLALAFMPVLMRLVHGADLALKFVDKLAHEPLGRAMRDMAQQGVQMINKFVMAAAHVVAKPLTLAFQIAFGTGKGGHEFASAVDNWWNQFKDYLFGYTATHRMNLPLEKQFAPITKSRVDGLFQPLIDWFNRHHFTKQGEQIGHGILDGLTSSGAAQKMGQFLITTLEDAMKTAVKGMIKAIVGFAQTYDTSVHHWGVELNNVISHAARDAWNYVKGLFSKALTLVVNVVPHFLGALGGLLGTTPTGPSTPSNPTGNRGKPITNIANIAGGGGINFHFHAAAGSSPAAERAAFDRFARQVGASLVRQQHVLAGGN